MDASAVKRVVDENIERLTEALGIPHWRLTIDYGPCSRTSWKAECVRDGGDYWRASITIDPIHAASPDDVVDSLVHELLHVILAPFDLYRNAITSHIEADTPQSRTEQVVWTHAVEQIVAILEKGLAAEYRWLPTDEEKGEEEDGEPQQ